MKIHFPHDNLSIDLPAGTTVKEACAAAGYTLNAFCGGKGNCGKCLVDIRQNGIIARVMACQHEIAEDMAILISSDGREDHLPLPDTLDIPFLIDPVIRVFPVDISALIAESKQSCKTFFDVLRSWLPVGLKPLSYEMLCRLNSLSEMSAPVIELITLFDPFDEKDDIIALIPREAPEPLYGFAIDIGTTSVAAYLVDLEDGCPLSTDAAINRQADFGADVISRMAYADGDDIKKRRLREAVTETIRQLMQNACKKHGIHPAQIAAVTYCGNTAMIHLFLGLDTRFLGAAPFISAARTALTIRHDTFGLPVSEQCVHLVLPGMGNFIGADTTAALLNLPEDDTLRLMIDLGTNGEIALGNGNHYLVTAAACGPAFEGANLTMGMRSGEGAIQSVTLTDSGFECQIIGGGTASGICGSGMIDAVACLLDIGLLKPDGAFASPTDSQCQPYRERFGETAKGEVFFALLTADENGGDAVIMTQNDIRMLQLAVGAIRVAWKMLLQQEDFGDKTLSAVILSGAFGAAVNLKNAKKIGLIPDFDHVHVQSIGNGAGRGAKLALLNRNALARAIRISETCRVINLATDDAFNTLLLENLSFEPVRHF